VSARRLALLFLGLLICLSGSVSADATAQRHIVRVESVLLPEIGAPTRERMELAKRMAFQVPGVSIAMVDDFALSWAKGYGVMEAGGAHPVTLDTLFQPGSPARSSSLTPSVARRLSS